jgi:endoglucanase
MNRSTKIISSTRPLAKSRQLVSAGVFVGAGTLLLIAALAAGAAVFLNIHTGVMTGGAKVVAASGSSDGLAVIFEKLGTSEPTPVPTASSTPKPTPNPTPVPTGWGLYVNPNSEAANQAAAWASSDPSGATEMRKIAAQPTAVWFGDWDTNVASSVSSAVNAAASAHAIAVLVAYNIPDRDCGGYSAGGATDASYPGWISQFASGLGSTATIVILEPDALPDDTCQSASENQTRLALLSNAVTVLKSHTQTKVYIDVGNPGWLTAANAAAQLKLANISAADGFSLNVSNFYTTAQSDSYGQAISAAVGGKHFIVDTSRNGLGSDGQWCNPPGRALGDRPTLSTGVAGADAYLWVKYPGESDGTCNGGPSAGTWWPSYALGLAQLASY